VKTLPRSVERADSPPVRLVSLPDDTAEKALRRQVQLNGQETWEDIPDAVKPAAGGGAMEMPPVPGGVPGFTAGGEPPRWDGGQPEPRVMTAPDDADDARWPQGRAVSERPHAAFPSGPQGMDGYWPAGQPQQQPPTSSPGGATGVPPSTLRQRHRDGKAKKQVYLPVLADGGKTVASLESGVEAEVTKVGPHGYEHGWKFVGISGGPMSSAGWHAGIASPPETDPQRVHDWGAGLKENIATGRPNSLVTPLYENKRNIPSGMWLREHFLGRIMQQHADAAASRGMPVEEFQRQAVSDLKQAGAKNHVAMRITNGNLSHILDDGVFKTQFESVTRNGKTIDHGENEIRAEQEAAWFGYPENTDPKLRPVYAYLTDGPDRPASVVPRTVPMDTDILSAFGTTQVVFKDGVKEHSTVNAGDSIKNAGSAMPSPLLDPGPESTGVVDHPFQPFGPASPELSKLQRDYSGTNWRGNNWLEVQVHSPDGVHRPLTTDDIDHVLFPSEPDGELASKLDAKNIPWKVWTPATIAKNGTAEEKARVAQVTSQDIQYVKDEISRRADFAPSLGVSAADFEKQSAVKSLRVHQKRLEKTLSQLQKAGVA
jgi:hypothetical protein